MSNRPHNRPNGKAPLPGAQLVELPAVVVNATHLGIEPSPDLTMVLVQLSNSVATAQIALDKSQLRTTAERLLQVAQQMNDRPGLLIPDKGLVIP